MVGDQWGKEADMGHCGVSRGLLDQRHQQELIISSNEDRALFEAAILEADRISAQVLIGPVLSPRVREFEQMRSA